MRELVSTRNPTTFRAAIDTVELTEREKDKQMSEHAGDKLKWAVHRLISGKFRKWNRGWFRKWMIVCTEDATESIAVSAWWTVSGASSVGRLGTWLEIAQISGIVINVGLLTM